jgi:hypothetical protein
MSAVPCRATASSRPRWELADIFRLYGESYRHTQRLPAAHLKVMHAIQTCRTEALGGHLQRCDSCGVEQPCYNSCRNRHCPKCGAAATDRWLQRQKQELLPTGYFHLVFTVPHELNVLFRTNPKILISILFKAVSETLSDFGRTHLHGRIGFLAVLHTWDQTLRDHFHLHCLIAGGALGFDGMRWIRARSNFLFHVKAVSLVFRAKFLERLATAYDKDLLRFPGHAAAFAPTLRFENLLSSVWKKKWVVYAKRPFSSPETVLDYLGRYTHRVAISNHRVVSIEDNKIGFLYRDRKDSSRQKTMTLDAGEFIRRFMLHVLPSGLMRIRHFGFLANRWKAAQLERCREILNVSQPAPPEPSDGFRCWIADRKRCQQCGMGVLIPIRTLAPRPWDSS